MIIGVPKEIKPQENRVGLVPSSVYELIRAGGIVLVEKNAGKGIGICDQEYAAVGAELVDSAEEIFSRSELIIKVKEPLPEECHQFREGQTLFTYLHLAANAPLTQMLKETGVTAIAYETVTQSDGGLPLLTPMSQVAGRMSIQAGAHCLEMAQGGSGILLGGVPGVARGNVLIIGAGVVGANAARIAMGMEANVTVLDKSLTRLHQLDLQFGSKLNTAFATSQALEQHLTSADLVVGAVLVPGAAAPKLVTREMLGLMRPRSVIVDVSIDQGGCFETSHPTTHHEPTYVVDDIVHYCVSNMPGAVPKTSTFALNNATLPYILNLVTKGVKQALLADIHLLNGLNVYQGKITYEAVATDLAYEYVKPQTLLTEHSLF